LEACVLRGWLHGSVHARPISLQSVQVKAKADDDDDEPAVAGKPLRVERLLANLGYGKRKECQILVNKGRATRANGDRLKVGDKVLHSDVVLDGEGLDPPYPLTIMLNKPVGYVVTTPDDDRIPDPKIYDLLPYRFGRRRPFLSSVGRLDKETSGLLLLTDDGQLVHKINSPKKGIWKVYEVTLGAPLAGKDAEAAERKFASGTLILKGDLTPLLPAKLVMLGENKAQVSICEGRYHQIRRMFASIGHEVVKLQRQSVGGLSLGDLPESEWRFMTQADIEAVFSGPSTEEFIAASRASAAGTSGAPARLKASSSEGQQHSAAAAAKTKAGAPSRGSSSQRVVVQKEGDIPGSRAGDEDSGSGDEEDTAVVVESSGTKRYKETERWKRRREALKKMVAAAE